MNRGAFRRRFPRPAAWLVAVTASFALASAAHARSAPRRWVDLAPPPLASDSAFASLRARPADSLDVGRLAWLEVQRDWREQRERETGRPVNGGPGSGMPEVHRARIGDTRFAALAAKPYGELTPDERSWLVIENAAQRLERERVERTGGVAGAVVFALVVGGLVGVLAVAYAASHTYWW